MRLSVYGIYFALCCLLLSTVEAQNKRSQKSKDIENGSEERYTKYKKEENHKKYKYKNDENDDRDAYKVNKYDKQNCRGKNCERSKTKYYDEDTYLAKDSKFLKYTKFTDESEQDPTYKKSKNRFNGKGKSIAEKNKEPDLEFKKKPKRSLIRDTEDYSEECDTVPRNKNNGNENEKKQFKVSRQKDEDHRSQSKTEKSKQEENKEIISGTDDDSGDQVNEVSKLKVQKNNKKSQIPKNSETGEENQKINKKKQRQHSVLPDDESDEETIDEVDDDSSDTSEETDESDETEEVLTDTCRKKSTCPEKKLRNEEDSDESDEIVKNAARKKKIKYSIKFAHEKQKNALKQNDNIMKKIHKARKHKYEDDNDDDSSEEHDHPKRIRYLEEDEE